MEHPTAETIYMLESHKWYIETFNLKTGLKLFKFKIEEQYKQGIIEPFLKGKYSQIDRSYVSNKIARMILVNPHNNT